MKDIKIYTTEWCSSCVLAKKALEDRGHSYKEINIEKEGISRKELKEITGRLEVPSIIIDGVNIGGFENLIQII